MSSEKFKSDINANELNGKSGVLYNMRKQWDKYVYTFCILVTYLCYGVCQNLFSPAMLDMMYLFRTSTSKILYVNTCNALGYLTGSLFGFLYNYINRQITLTLSVVVLGVFVAVMPFCTSIWLLYGSMFISAAGGGVWDAGNSMWAIEMWKEHSPSVLQLSQTMFGLGSIVAPLLAKPFLYGDLSNDTETTTTAAMTTSSPLTTTTDINYSVDRRPKLETAFLIAGCSTLIIPVILFVMFVVKRYKYIPTQNDSQENKPEKIDDIKSSEPSFKFSKQTRYLLVALVALSLNSYNALEVIFFNSGPTYFHYIPIKISVQKAADIMSVMTGTYTFGRFISAFIASKLKAETMIIYHSVIISCSLVILYFGRNSEPVIWFGNALIGFGFSAMWPSYFSFAEKYIQLNNKITAIFSFVSQLFTLASPFLIGPLIEKDPMVFLELELAYLVITILIFIAMLWIVKRSQTNSKLTDL